MRLVVIAGSDAGISAGLRARELDPSVEVRLLVADAFPNFSICGLPYYLSGDVPDWRDLAHRTSADLEAAGLELLLDHIAQAIDPVAEKADPGMASGGPLDWIRPDRGIARSLHGQSLLGSERPGLPRGSGMAGRVASFARLMHRRVRAFGPAFGRRRLRRQSQPILVAPRVIPHGLSRTLPYLPVVGQLVPRLWPKVICAAR